MPRLTPTTLTVRALTDAGYVAGIVERRAGPNTHDLFGFIDVLAIRGDEVVAVQCTDATNVAARVRKIADAEHLGAVRAVGWRIEVHGWRTDGRVRVVDVS